MNNLTRDRLGALRYEALSMTAQFWRIANSLLRMAYGKPAPGPDIMNKRGWDEPTQAQQVDAYRRIFIMSEAWGDPANALYQEGDDLLVKRVRDLAIMVSDRTGGNRRGM